MRAEVKAVARWRRQAFCLGGWIGCMEDAWLERFVDWVDLCSWAWSVCPSRVFVFTSSSLSLSSLPPDHHQIMHALCPRSFCTALESWRHTDSPHVTPTPPPPDPHPVTGQRGPLGARDWPAGAGRRTSLERGAVGEWVSPVLFSIAASGL